MGLDPGEAVFNLLAEGLFFPQLGTRGLHCVSQTGSLALKVTTLNLERRSPLLVDQTVMGESLQARYLLLRHGERLSYNVTRKIG